MVFGILTGVATLLPVPVFRQGVPGMTDNPGPVDVTSVGRVSRGTSPPMLYPVSASTLKTKPQLVLVLRVRSHFLSAKWAIMYNFRFR